MGQGKEIMDLHDYDLINSVIESLRINKIPIKDIDNDYDLGYLRMTIIFEK